MKKIIYLLPLLLVIVACGVQSQPTQNVSDVNATLTAAAQNNLQGITPQTTVTTVIITQSTPSAVVAPPSVQTVFSPTPCLENWFFSFNNEHLALGSFCPQAVKTLAAIGQDFEGGRVLLYAPDPSYPVDQRGTLYIIYNDGEWITMPDTWDTSQPVDDPNIVIPKGLYQPVKSIGKVWRENAEIRDRLGFAYEPESKFTGRMQLYSTQPGQPQGDTHFFFLDHGKWGLVLVLNSVDMGPNKWEAAGKYQ